jgi:hypothetical protein
MFQAHLQNCEKRQLISFFISVRPSIRLLVGMEQFGSHWTNFDENRRLSSIRSSVGKIQVLLKSGKINGYFT